MKKKRKRAILVFLIATYILYIFFIFPNFAGSYKNKEVLVPTSDWETNNPEELKFYYIEPKEKPKIGSILDNCVDSVSVVDFSHRSHNTLILKQPQKSIKYLTNNFSSSALICYSAYEETENEDYLKIFWAHVNWMIENLSSPVDSVAVWKNEEVTFKKYNLGFGWPSAYAQGYGLSVLCRAYQESGNSRYLKIAEMVLNSFNLSYKQDGVMDIDEDGNCWYLEFPAEPPAYVLNGMIYALFGIYDFYRITDSPKARHYFARGVETLSENLKKYDLGYWSAYDLYYHDCSSYNYHRNVHIPQLRSLYYITQNPIFKVYANRFEEYLNEPWLTIFKTNFSIEALIRRIKYKNPFMI